MAFDQLCRICRNLTAEAWLLIGRVELSGLVHRDPNLLTSPAPLPHIKGGASAAEFSLTADLGKL